MSPTKRQNNISLPDFQSADGFYYKEWAIFAAVVLSVIAAIVIMRVSGRRRIRKNLPLKWYQKFFFPRALRNGPPYDLSPVPLNYVYPTPSRYGQSDHIVPPPPSYDPYATNLPAYQAKAQESTVGQSEVPAPAATPAQDQDHRDYTYIIPQSIARR